MGPSFVGHVDVDVLGLPTGPLGLLGLIPRFTQFTLFNDVDDNDDIQEDNDVDDNDDIQEDNNTSTSFKVKALKDIDVDGGKKPLFVVFLTNIIPNKRMWNALHMHKNMDIIKKVLCSSSLVSNLGMKVEDLILLSFRFSCKMELYYLD